MRGTTRRIFLDALLRPKLVATDADNAARAAAQDIGELDATHLDSLRELETVLLRIKDDLASRYK